MSVSHSDLFIDRTLLRRLPSDYEGDVLLWDIDKTYLDTHFSSWRGLLRIPFEFAVDKESIPGSVPLLRALRRGPGDDSALVPLLFVSGSPPQLRRVIERRMTLDGVDFDGVTFKDQLGLLVHGRPKALKEQVGYKLMALLLNRAELPDGAQWLMFGDDVEYDADVFVLFGEVCGGLRGADLSRRLQMHRVPDSEIAAICKMAEGIRVTADPVQRIFIHLESGTDPSQFVDARVVATRSYLQTAYVLTSMGRIKREAVAAVARDLRMRGVPESELDGQARDAQQRLGVPSEVTSLSRRTA